MAKKSDYPDPADLRDQASRVRYMKTVLIAGFFQAILALARLSAQTYVQVAELNPTEPIGARITSTVTQAKPSGRKLFGGIGDKVTYVDWISNPPTAYQFASDN